MDMDKRVCVRACIVKFDHFRFVLQENTWKTSLLGTSNRVIDVYVNPYDGAV